MILDESSRDVASGDRAGGDVASGDRAGGDVVSGDRAGGDIAKIRMVVIGGPTASGKTEAAIRLADQAGGEIVSADSVQVYRHLDIGSAKPTEEQRRLVLHHMIDVVDPNDPMTAARYADMAHAAIADIQARGKTVIVAGGSGLYLRALIRGLLSAPQARPKLRRELRATEARQGPGTLHRMLEQVDPRSAARLHPADLIRIVRAIEVWKTTGRTMSDLQAEHAFADAPYETRILCLDPGKEALEERLIRRVDEMIDAGLVDEVEQLLAAGWSNGLKPLQSPGYRQALEVLAGRMTLDEARGAIVTAHRRYARRQRVWFRSEPGVHWYQGPDDLPYENLAAWIQSGETA